MRGSSPKPDDEVDETSIDGLRVRPDFDSRVDELPTREHPATVDDPTVNVKPDAPTVTRTVDRAAIQLAPTMASPLGLDPVEPAPEVRPPLPTEDYEDPTVRPLPAPVSAPVVRTAIFVPGAAQAKPVRPFAPGLKAIEDDEEDDGPRTVTAKVPVLLVDGIVAAAPPRRKQTKTARMLPPNEAAEPIPLPAVEPQRGRRTTLFLALGVVLLLVAGGVAWTLRARARASAKPVTEATPSAEAVQASASSADEDHASPPTTDSAAHAHAHTRHGRGSGRPKPSGTGIVRDAPF